MNAQFGEVESRALGRLLKLALEEDLGEHGDVTSQAVIPEELPGQAVFVMRSAGVLSGSPVIGQVCAAIDGRLRYQLFADDGQFLKAGGKIGLLSGPLRAILVVERTALNFLQRLSGIATLTRRYVDQIAGTRCQVLDTRKTTPGWRVLEKYAVRCGGGTNHRMGLYDAVMIKDNHLAGLREHGTPISAAIQQARTAVGKDMIVEVEVENLDQLKEALTAQPDVVLLDNMKPELMTEAVRIRNQQAPGVRLEASGGVTLLTIGTIAKTGVDCVSVGALTHSAPALDIALDYQE